MSRRRVDYSALTERVCSVCKSTKPISAFGRYRDSDAPLGWRYHSRCCDCNKMACREYGAASKDKRNARLKKWRADNKRKAAALDRRKKLARYGLTEADVERMSLSQGWRCVLCRRAVPLVIDHCHDTGRVRGLLCSPCNSHLGWAEMDGILDRIKRYLEIANEERACVETADPESRPTSRTEGGEPRTLSAAEAGGAPGAEI